ncbi:MAG: arginyltransferase [Marinagarivorans sp.]|nr:arginyltransferase [Marinagarivorans sp.]
MTNTTQLKLFATQAHSCSYLPNQEATTVFIDPNTEIDINTYTGLSHLGFRRSGKHVYKPHCNDCRACVSVRIPVTNHNPTRHQKRCIKYNNDLEIGATNAPNIEEHYALYERYITLKHSDGDMNPPSRKQYEDFLSNPLGCTQYFEFRKKGQLIACSVSDKLTHGLSAIYTYYCPSENKRSLGKLAILHQIQASREQGLEYLYLGYWIKDCQKMSYKTEYRPLEMLIDQQWVTVK